LLKITKKLFLSFYKNEIKYCHWKSNEHLKEGLIGKTDLDLLVDCKDKKKCEENLLKVGFLKFNPQKGSKYKNVEEWIGLDSESGNLIHVHLHYNMITGYKHIKEYKLPWDNYVLNNRVEDKETGVFKASPNIEIVILYTRIALKSHEKQISYIKKEYIKEINYLKSFINDNKVKQACNFMFNKESEVIYGLIKKQTLNKTDLKKLRKSVVVNLANVRQGNKLYSLVKYMYYKLLTKSKIKLNKINNSQFIVRKTPINNKGFSICFIGSDGAGKSTVMNDINKWFLWKIDSKKFYLGSGEQYKSTFKYAEKFYKKFLYKRNNNIKKEEKKEQSKTKNSHNTSKKEKVKAIIFSYELLRISKYKLRTIKKIKKYINNGGIAILDRIPQNQYEGIYDGPKINEKYGDIDSKIIKFLSIKEKKYLNKAIKYEPSVIFKLLLPPEESLKRKPEHNLKDIKIKSKITENLSFKASSIYKIDAMQQYEKELLEVKKIIWEEMINQL